MKIKFKIKIKILYKGRILSQ